MSVLRAETTAEKAEAILRFVVERGTGGELEIESLSALYETLPNARELLAEAGASGRVLITAGGLSLNGPAWDRVYGETED